MRYLIVMVLLLPLGTVAQTKNPTPSQKDYENAVSKFVKYFNANNVTAICRMFSDDTTDRGYKMWKKAMPEIKSEYPKIESYDYLGIDNTDPEKVRVFKMKAGVIYAMSLTLKDKHFGTFRFRTTSPAIDSMLQPYMPHR